MTLPIPLGCMEEERITAPYPGTLDIYPLVLGFTSKKARRQFIAEMRKLDPTMLIKKESDRNAKR